MIEFLGILARDEADLVVGVRTGRTGDPWLSAFTARVFWGLYRRLVQREMPSGGVDVFACNRTFRDHLITLDEAHSSLVALTLWLGFRRATVPYERQMRQHGISGWTLRKKVKYLSDSIFSFTDLPIRVLLATGILGLAVSIVVALVVLAAKVTGTLDVPGYAATTLLISFFGALNLSGLGIIGAYVWRAFENTKARPSAVVMIERDYPVGAASPRTELTRLPVKHGTD
jgi:hypothetical protein